MPLNRIVLIATAALLLAVLLSARWVYGALNQPLQVAAAAEVFVVEPGMSMRQVASSLAADGILTQPRILSLYARFTGQAGKIQAGEYLLGGGQTARELLDDMVAGRVRLHSVTLLEGWTVREMLAEVRRHPAVLQTLGDKPDVAALGTELGLPYAHAEGLFYPDTYKFPRGTSDRELLQQAYELLNKELTVAWEQRVPGGVITTPYELLILGSIIERETAVDDERADIAGVFNRRLQKRMRLQTDPTVIYGLGEAYDGNITRRDLKTDTPYNTYTRFGLPPTPIGLVSRASLQAAAAPADGEALYFVATGDGSGRHVFSNTLEQHNSAVAAYLKRLREQR